MRSNLLRKNEPYNLAAVVLLSMVIHWPFMLSGFGEPDVARMAIVSSEWHTAGYIPDYSYYLRTSPLLLQFIKGLLDAGVPYKHIPGLLNWLNLFLCSLTLVPLYLLWRHLANPRVAAIATIFFFFTPTFWSASLYGTAHLPAFAFFVTSLLLFTLSLRRNVRTKNYLMVGSVLLAVLAADLKADYILCFGAYAGVAFYTRAVSPRSVALSVLIPVVSFIAVTIHTQAIAPDIPPLEQSVGTWAGRFPFTIQAILDHDNRMVFVNAAGGGLVVVVVMSILYCVIRRTGLRAVTLALLWALPPILFWGLKMGNSLRHMMCPFAALLFLPAITLVGLSKSARIRWATVAIVLIVNYFLGPVQSKLDPYQMAKWRKISVRARHELGVIGASMRVGRRLCVGTSGLPYVVWESLASAERYEVVTASPKVYRLFYRDGSIEMFRADEVQGPATVGPSEEWFIYSCDPDVRALNHSSWSDRVKGSNSRVRPDDP
jgi:hypothetical protein